MLYYRVKPECDQTPRIKFHRYAHKRVQDGVFTANELYTSRELDAFYIPFDKVLDIFEPVRIPKNKIYWFFGCRFEEGVNWNGKQQ